MMGFKVWLKTQTHRDEPVGDIARDAVGDRCWPKGNAKLGTLIEHLESHGASSPAIEALRDAYGEWCGPTVTGWLKREREGAARPLSSRPLPQP